MRFFYKMAVVLPVFLIFSGFPASRAAICLAQDSASPAGWEKGGEYDRHYDASELDDLKGAIEEISEVTPLPGMAPGVGLIVRDQDGDSVKIHLGPKGFVKLEAAGIKKGDKVKVKGAWTEFDGKEIFMASKVKKGENIELKVRRTKDGTPFWSLSAEELAKEKEQ